MFTANLKQLLNIIANFVPVLVTSINVYFFAWKHKIAQFIFSLVSDLDHSLRLVSILFSTSKWTIRFQLTKIDRTIVHSLLLTFSLYYSKNNFQWNKLKNTLIRNRCTLFNFKTWLNPAAYANYYQKNDHIVWI